MIKLTVSTDQEAFDTALRGVMGQGARCMGLDHRDDGMMCSFWNDKGHACAVGHLMRPEDRKKVTNSNIELLRNSREVDVGSGINIHLLTSLQSAHDDAYDQDQDTEVEVDDMERYLAIMRNVANTYHLSTKVLDTYE